jgi:hypothetical protein
VGFGNSTATLHQSTGGDGGIVMWGRVGPGVALLEFVNGIAPALDVGGGVGFRDQPFDMLLPRFRLLLVGEEDAAVALGSWANPGIGRRYVEFAADVDLRGAVEIEGGGNVTTL